MRILEFLIKVVAVDLAVDLRSLWSVVVPLLLLEEVEGQERVSPRKIFLHQKMALGRRLWLILKYFILIL